MAKDGKPFVQGIQFNSIPHEEGKASIEYFKKLGCTYSVSFLHKDDPGSKEIIKDNVDVLFLHYKHGGTTTKRIVQYLEEAKRKRKDVYLLYKRKMDGQFCFYSFDIDGFGDVDFRHNITQLVLEEIRGVELDLEYEKIKPKEMKKEYCSQIHEKSYPVFDEDALHAQLTAVKYNHSGILLRRRRKRLK